MTEGVSKQIAKKPRRRVSKPWKELVKQKEGLMRTLKEKRKGNEEAELMLPNFYAKNQNRSLRSAKTEELALKAIEVENEKEKQAQMFKTQEAMITNMVKQQDQMQTLQKAF